MSATDFLSLRYLLNTVWWPLFVVLTPLPTQLLPRREAAGTVVAFYPTESETGFVFEPVTLEAEACAATISLLVKTRYGDILGASFVPVRRLFRSAPDERLPVTCTTVTTHFILRKEKKIDWIKRCNFLRYGNVESFTTPFPA